MLKIEKNIPLKDFTTFKIGGRAKYFAKISDKDQLKEILIWAKDKKIPIFVLGGGSNVLFSDKGFNGLVLKIENREISLKKKNKIFVGSGVFLSRLVLFCKDKELSGFEWAAGIPGTVGGAIYGNAGAFGGEIKDNIEKVFTIDKKNLKEKIFLKKDCKFSYRSSIFKKKNQYIILGAIFSLKKGDKKTIQKEIKEKIFYRKEHHPLNFPSAGSIFKSVPFKKIKKEIIKKYPEILIFKEKKEVPAGFLIEKSNLGDKKIGGAVVSEKHKNFIINVNQAKAKDVISLIKLIKKEVKKNFKVDLEEEIIIV